MTISIKACLLVFWLCVLANAPGLHAQNKSTVLTFASDTQAPMLVERLWLKSNQNEKATRMIFHDVIAVHPAALFILGDVVSLSYKNSKWVKMDEYLHLCAQNGTSVYAALGNHELMINARRGERNFQSRFPMHNHAGYLEIVDSVAVMLLNSNFSKMTDSANLKQDAWYNATLKKLDDDPAIRYVIVGCHHSPFTNSKIVGPSQLVQQKFVPAFIKSKKCVLFLSGHSHNFEHFNVHGKTFLVIGGGGGLHQPLHAENKDSHDLSAAYKPMFHYLQVRRYRDSLMVISRQLKPDFSGFTDGLRFEVTN
jgi:Calcineurin-like phosphoesterase